MCPIYQNGSGTSVTTLVPYHGSEVFVTRVRKGWCDSEESPLGLLEDYGTSVDTL